MTLPHNQGPLKSKAVISHNPPTPPVKAEVYLQIIKDIFIAHSFNAQIADYQHFHKHWKGSVVVLAGGSTAGKSTIVNALKNVAKGMVEEGSDLTGANFIYAFMKKNYTRFGISKDEWNHLHKVLVPRKDNWHIHEAVGKDVSAKVDEFDFKPGVSQADKERAIKTAKALRDPVEAFAARTSQVIDDIVMDQVLEHARSGKDAVFDILDIDKVLAHPLSTHTHIKTVLVYCPFGKLAARLAERNRKALVGEIDLSEVRAGAFPLEQYAKLVRPKKANDPEQAVIDRVTRRQVEKDFEATFDAGVNILKKTPEGMAEVSKIEKRRELDKQALLKAFGFVESDALDKTIELVPKRHYDLLIEQ